MTFTITDKLSLVLFLVLPVLGAARLDAQVQTFTTTAPSGALAPGSFFDVTAASTLVIKGVDVEAFNSSTAYSYPLLRVFEVWALGAGESATNHLHLFNDWSRVGFVQALVPLGTTTVSINLSEEIRILAGETRGFCVMVHGFSPNIETRLINSSAPTGSSLGGNLDLSVTAQPTTYYWLTPQYYSYSFHGSLRYELHPMLGQDLGIDALRPLPGPAPCQNLSALSQIEFDVRNLGTASLPAGATFSVALGLDGLPAGTAPFTLAQALAPLDSATLVFPGTVDLSGPGSHAIDLTAQVPGDGYAGNDHFGLIVANDGPEVVRQFPWIEDFSGVPTASVTLVPAGWQQDDMDGTGPGPMDWFFTNGDHVLTAGLPDRHGVLGGADRYALLFDTWDFPALRLFSPCLDLTNVVHPRLDFWMNPGPAMGSTSYFSIDVLELSTNTLHLDVFGPEASGVAPGPWVQHLIDLSAFAGEQIKLVLRSDMSSPNYSTMIIVDDLRVLDLLPTPGQTPQPGLAQFDLAGAANVNGDAVALLQGGPYFVAKSAGDSLDFSFEGLPFEPIYLLGGPLNPVAATFPNVGQMDIGGTIDLVTGLPIGIQVLADGTSGVGFGPLFVTDVLGAMSFSIAMPFFPTGPVTTFQAAILTGGANGSWVALSNAIELNAL